MQSIIKCPQLFTSVFAVLIFALSSAPSRAAMIYDESINGDFINADFFSSTGYSPGTPVSPFSVGSNLITGEIGNVLGSGDDDIFTFIVPVGHQLEAIILEYTTTGNVGNGSYFAINDGPEVATRISNTWDNLGDALISSSKSIMGDLQTGTALSSAAGLLAPSPAGTYSMFLSEFSGAHVSYTLDFQVTAVPEPGSAVLACFGLLIGGGSLVWKKRRSR